MSKEGIRGAKEARQSNLLSTSLFGVFASEWFYRDVRMKFQNFKITEIWLLEMKFEMSLEILKLR